MPAKMIMRYTVIALIAAASLCAFNKAEISGLPDAEDMLAGVSEKDFSIGGGAQFTAMSSDDARIAEAYHIVVPEKKKNAWDVSFLVKTTSPIAEGDTLLLVFYARAAVGNTTADITVKLQKASPEWDSIASVSFKAQGEWKRFTVPCMAKRAFDKGDVKLAFILGSQKQDVDIGGIMLVNFKGSIALEDLKRQSTADYPDVPLVIAPFANMGFADEAAGDGKGGWSDQGSARDLSAFDVKRTDFAGISMRIADPAENGGKAVMVFRSPHINAAVDRAEAKIPCAGAKGKFIYILHAAAWCSKDGGEKVGTVTIDRKSGTSISHDIISGRDVGDWISPRGLENGRVAYTGKTAGGPIAGLYLSRFRIAYAAEEISSVAFTTAGAAIWMVVGATVSSKEIVMEDRPKKRPRLVNTPYVRTKPLIMSDGGTVIVTPAHVTNAVINPGKGWVLYRNPKDQPPEVMALGALGYQRYQWGTLEPAEGEFKWESIDRDIEAWSNEGKQFAFGVMSASTHSKSFWATPKYVFDAGAKYQSFELTGPKMETAGSPGKKLIPSFDDPIYLEKLSAFIRALAARYDGHPNIAFIDIRSYGNWGEAHMGFSAPFRLEDISSERFKEHLMIHRSAFKRTMLQVCAGRDIYQDVYAWAVENGIGLRRDGICGNSDGSDVLGCAGKLPAVFEFYGEYEMMLKLGWWHGKKDTSGNGYRLDACVETGMPTFCDLSRGGKGGQKMIADEPVLVHELANRIGYHFVITEARYPKAAAPDRPFSISIAWENRGVAPIYIPASAAFALIAPDDRVVSVSPARVMKLSALRSDTPITLSDSLQFAAPAGEYTLAVGILEPEKSSPTIKIGIDVRSVDGWQCLGPISIK